MLHIIIITKKKKTFAGKGIRLNLLNKTTTTNVAGRKKSAKKIPHRRPSWLLDFCRLITLAFTKHEIHDTRYICCTGMSSCSESKEDLSLLPGNMFVENEIRERLRHLKFGDASRLWSGAKPE